MPITEHQRKRRRKHLGASDLPAIFGFDPWKSAEDVRLSKLHDTSFDSSDAMELGSAIEGHLIDWAAEQRGIKVRKNVSRVCEREPILSASLDAIEVAEHPEQAIEAKMTTVDDDWGEPGTDEVPDRVVIQAHGQMVVAGVQTVWVPVAILCRPIRRVIYRVDFDAEIGAEILELIPAWWRKHVEGNVPCDGQPAQLETYKRLKREPQSRVTLTAEQAREIDFWQAFRSLRLKNQKEEEEHFARVLQLLGTAEAADVPGVGELTYLEQTRKAYSVPESTYRVAKWKPIKRED